MDFQLDPKRLDKCILQSVSIRYLMFFRWWSRFWHPSRRVSRIPEAWIGPPSTMGRLEQKHRRELSSTPHPRKNRSVFHTQGAMLSTSMIPELAHPDMTHGTAIYAEKTVYIFQSYGVSGRTTGTRVRLPKGSPKWWGAMETSTNVVTCWTVQQKLVVTSASLLVTGALLVVT